MSFISGAYFEVALFGTGVGLMGNFLSVTGLDVEFEYEVYCEGGSRYPRYFYKQAKPQTLVLEQGTVTSTYDGASILANLVNAGGSIPLAGVITLKVSLN